MGNFGQKITRLAWTTWYGQNGMIEKAHDRKFWLFHVNTLRYAQLISIQLLHTIRHLYGRFMLGYHVRVPEKFKSKSKPSESVDFQS